MERLHVYRDSSLGGVLLHTHIHLSLSVSVSVLAPRGLRSDLQSAAELGRLGMSAPARDPLLLPFKRLVRVASRVHVPPAAMFRPRAYVESVLDARLLKYSRDFFDGSVLLSYENVKVSVWNCCSARSSRLFV